MTNLKTIDDHKIAVELDRLSVAVCLCSASRRRSEGGYTLVALLAMMTVLALFAMAVAPAYSNSRNENASRKRSFVVSKSPTRSVITIVIDPELVAVSAPGFTDIDGPTAARSADPRCSKTGRYFVLLRRAIH
jgi:hypothetical protein